MLNRGCSLLVVPIIAALTFVTGIVRADDPLPSWNDGKAKQSIITFVERVTTQGSPEFVVPAARIATFDNDGTLWCEQPMYVQAFFVLDRIKQMAPQHPEWKDKEPFASVLKGDREFHGDTPLRHFPGRILPLRWQKLTLDVEGSSRKI